MGHGSTPWDRSNACQGLRLGKADVFGTGRVPDRANEALPGEAGLGTAQVFVIGRLPGRGGRSPGMHV